MRFMKVWPLLFATACSTQTPQPHAIFLAADAPAATALAAADLQKYLNKLQPGTVSAPQNGSAACTKNTITVALQTKRSDTPDLGENGYEIRRSSCANDGVLITTYGASALAAQFAVYDLLEQVGVRFYHPEEEFLPPAKTRLAWATLPEDTLRAPLFREREVYSHTAHPIELQYMQTHAGAETDAQAKRWIDWCVKNRLTNCQSTATTTDYLAARGYTATSGQVNLFESEQGSVPLLESEPADAAQASVVRAQNEQRLSDNVESQFAASPGMHHFGITFNASEFPDQTPEDDQTVVHYLSFLASYFSANHPGTILLAIDQGTATLPTPYYHVNYFDLPQFAPANLGLEIHPLMFYDLSGPAPIYGNTDNHRLRDIMQQLAPSRPISFFPEDAWWLTFDIPVPLYLPITMHARASDIALLAPLTQGADDAHGLQTQQLFSTGQEWGYWQNDWCGARMAFDATFTDTDCVNDIAAHTTAPALVKEAITQTTALEVTDLTGANPLFIRYLVGSDDQTESGDAAGVHFHPLPPQPLTVAGWSAGDVQSFRANERVRLRVWADTLGALSASLTMALAPGDKIGTEIRDAIEITGLRAAHMLEVMDAALSVNDARSTRNASLIDSAQTHFANAKAITQQAAAIVARREAAYRYPLSWSTSGDEAGTPGAEQNGTQYTYRYLGRTHRLFYWTRPEAELDHLLNTPQAVQLSQRILTSSEALTVQLQNFSQGSLSVSYGDGGAAETTLQPHTYAGNGLFDFHLLAVGDVNVDYSDKIGVAPQRLTAPLNSFSVTSPSGAAVLNGLLPAMVLGVGSDFVVFGADTDNDGIPEQNGVVHAALSGHTTAALDLPWPLVDGGSGQILGQITLYGCTLTLDALSPSALGTLTMHANLAVDDIANLLVTLAAFDPAGARQTVAGVLGYTVDTLPDQVAVSIAAQNLH
jgi:hypothetical protein